MAKVTLRKKAISKGRSALYLDYYPLISHPDTGKPTRREYLKIYVYDRPRTEIDKEHNRETSQLAESLRAMRQIEIQNQQYGFLNGQTIDVTTPPTDANDLFKEKNEQGQSEVLPSVPVKQ